jgi:DNA-binding transcriptional ArsR family regulator
VEASGPYTETVPVRYSPDPDVAAVAALIGEPTRAAMLLALLDGRRLSAGELARRGGVSAPAASAHLAKLVAGGMLVVEPAGRRRLYRIARSEVGDVMERLAALAPPPRIVALGQNTVAANLRHARSCYDHLAGKLGVAVTDALVARRALVAEGTEGYRLTASGRRFLVRLGVDVGAVEEKRRVFARQCVDWSERRPHLAGALGAAVRERFLARGWVTPSPSSRALRLTRAGSDALEAFFALRF